MKKIKKKLVHEICALLAYNAALSANYRRFGITYRSYLQG